MINEAAQDIELNLERIRQQKRAIKMNMQQNKENPSVMEILQGFWERMIVAEKDLEIALVDLIDLRD
tara:strand:- start:195 stop:395 length:201 start_codon:yes stop_codon:yes gene_type:complete